jgi:hypothetical protein
MPEDVLVCIELLLEAVVLTRCCFLPEVPGNLFVLELGLLILQFINFCEKRSLHG